MLIKKHVIKFCNYGKFFSATLERFNLPLNASLRKEIALMTTKIYLVALLKSTSFNISSLVALENESFSNGSTKIDLGLAFCLSKWKGIRIWLCVSHDDLTEP